MTEPNKTRFRTFSFGLVKLVSNGVLKSTYTKLYPKPAFYGGNENDLGTQIRTMLGAKSSLLVGKISASELEARMQRTKIYEINRGSIPEYEESQGFFRDFEQAVQIGEKMIDLTVYDDYRVGNVAIPFTNYDDNNPELDAHRVFLHSPKGVEYRLQGCFNEGHKPQVLLSSPTLVPDRLQAFNAFLEQHIWEGGLEFIPDIWTEKNYENGTTRILKKTMRYQFKDQRRGSDVEAWRDTFMESPFRVYGSLRKQEDFINRLIRNLDNYSYSPLRAVS